MRISLTIQFSNNLPGERDVNMWYLSLKITARDQVIGSFLMIDGYETETYLHRGRASRNNSNIATISFNKGVFLLNST